MADQQKAEVFMTGGSQAVRLPQEFQVEGHEVSVRRDARTGDLILSTRPSLQEIFAAFDELGVPEDFLNPDDRPQDLPAEKSGF